MIELLEDMVVDIPFIYDNVANIVAALLKAKFVDYPWFQAEARRLLPSEPSFAR